MDITTVLVGGGVLGLLVVIGQLKDKYDEAKKRREMELANLMVIERSMQVIGESLDFVANSKNMKTRLSRMSVAIEVCQGLIDQFPGDSTFDKMLDDLFEVDSELNMEDLETRIAKNMDKANSFKSVSSKVNNASKCLVDIEEISRRKNVDMEKINELRQQVTNYIHDVELCGLKDKAALLELKGKTNKAAEAYCDILFYLKNDHIDDELQADQLESIEHKIESLRSRIDAPQSQRSKTRKTIQ